MDSSVNRCCHGGSTISCELFSAVALVSVRAPGPWLSAVGMRLCSMRGIRGAGLGSDHRALTVRCRLLVPANCCVLIADSFFLADC
jgi:hypothetical protein